MAVEKMLSKISCDNWLVVFGILVAILLRNITMLHPHSGEGNPPMYGDYEAQRHWMEITTNLPVLDWYQNKTENNLEYWGLDYPPLTAYHMYLCGLFAKYLNENYTLLHKSQGFESDDHKLFMRITVLICDVLVYIPSLVIFYYLNINGQKSETVCEFSKQVPLLPFSLTTILGLLYPGIILVDHGHFQYNNVSLGLTTLSVIFLIRKKNIFATMFFCFALNYKQMELYHSLPFFFYLLSTCIPKPGKKAIGGIISLFQLAVTVVLSFSMIWFPFLLDLEVTHQVLHRLFPFSRGIFEDKVANFWCALNIIYKLKTCNHAKLMRICLFTTLSAVFPSSVDLFLRPNLKKFVLALINSSLAFFLFSYHVHEKTILVVSLPILLHFPENPFVCFWFLYISVFSMIPLFVKDGLILAMMALLLFYILSFYACMKYYYHSVQNQPNTSQIKCSRIQFLHDMLNIKIKKLEKSGSAWGLLLDRITKDKDSLKNLFFFSAMFFSFIGSVIIFISSLIFEPPMRYPDLFTLLISVYSCLHFLGFFVYFNVKQIEISQDFGDIGNVKLKEY
ncbi:hypothetical protein WA026_002532 [Henosepilachna vigintioctopunctata]|uniref:Alpha-1,3-glucosyltransferase n=1 Tax=Henosepilachna vigintioctopunctata TaxID=420089 RepID=A0AAW1TV10_9CUCU